MKILLRKKEGSAWYDITRYVNMPIPILDTGDDNFDNIVIEALLDSTFTFSDYTKAIPPKNLLKITYAETPAQENERNTYMFWTSNNNTARLRKETNGKTALYNHIIKGEELKKMLGWFNQPSYAVTQQKRSILQYDYRDVIVTYTNLGGRFEASGTTPYQIPIGTKRTDFNYNNGGNEVEVDYVGNKHKVIINDIANTPYVVNYTYSLSRSARTRFKYLGFIDTEIVSSTTFAAQPVVIQNRNLKYTITKRYYDNTNSLINTEEEVLLKQYTTDSFVTESGLKITSLPEPSQQQINIVVGTNSFADYVVIEVDVVHEVPQHNMRYDVFAQGYVTMDTNISGFNDNYFVKTAIDQLEIEVLSSNTVTPSVFQDITYKQFLDKVIFDYNANNMLALDYAEDYSLLLGEFMNDGEYDEMSTLEIFERIADLLDVEFYLNNNFKIMFLQKTVSSITLDLNGGLDVQEQIDDIDYVDTAVLSGKNVLSTNDFVREKILIGSTAEEYTYLLEDTIKEYGFKLSKGILELREALLYLPITITLQNENDTPIEIKGNTDLGDGWWNITTRVFDEDTYNSLPNTRADMYSVAGFGYNHAMDTRLYRSTALSFKVGGKEINNVLYRAETLPELLPSWLEFNAGSGISEYAIINILIVLAIEKAVEEEGYVTSNITFDKPNIEWTDPVFKEAVLDISYIPIFDKITAKFVNDEKESLKVEKRLTAEGKNISFENAEELYIKEIKSKAVDEKTYDLNHNTFEDTFEVGSIINDGYYIYSKKMLIETNNKMSVTYGLSKNIESSVKARDIGFSSQYDNKYMIPIEYVTRELMIENHLIIGGVNAGSTVGCSADFIYDLFNKSFDGRRMWGLLNLTYESDDDKILVMRMGAIKAKRTLVIQGQFVDNYNAGNQNYTTASGFRQSSPYRYTDVNGRVKSVNRLKIGYNQLYDEPPTLVKDTDLAYNYVNPLDDEYLDYPYSYTEPYELNLFPQGEHYNSSSVVDKVAYIDTNYLPYGDEWLLWKDSREALRVNFLTTIENRDKDKLEFYQIAKVQKVALRSGEKIWGQETTDFTIDVVESFGNYIVTIKILSGLGTDPAFHSLGLSLIGNELGADILVAEIKQPTIVDENTVEFQIASIRSRTKPTRNVLDNLIITFEEILNGSLTSINSISETLGVTLGYDYGRYEYQQYNLMIAVKETLDSKLIDINSISETIGAEVVYDYRSYGSLTANLMIQLSETLNGDLVNIDNISETLGVTLGYSSYYRLTTNLFIGIQETLSGELVNVNNISEEIFVTLGYNGSGYFGKHYSLNIETKETLSGELVSINTLYEVINTFIGFEGNKVTQTIAPTVGTPYCINDGGTNSYRVLISNNENMSVTIRNGNTVLGTMTALETSKEFIFTSGQSTPYNYNINITAQASGLQRSTNVNRSGTIHLCSLP